MTPTAEMNKNIHHGRNIKRFREMLGIKQEGLAYELGDDWTQKRVSLLEQKEFVEQDILDQVARILKVPTEAIKNFDEETAIYNIQNNYEGSNNQGPNLNYQCHFNPVEKIVELYERMLLIEREKSDLLQRLLDVQNKNT